ncbi:MAG: GNAT family N-acetyltransferase [Bacillota bacterium]
MSELRIRTGRAEDIPQVLDVIEESFRFGYYGGVRENPDERDLFEYLYHLPDFRPEWLVVGEADGRLVSLVGMFPRPTYIGGAVIDSWMLSPAATLKEYRGRGYMVRLIEELERQVVAHGGTLVLLHGVPDYYPRAGFVKCLPYYEVVVRPDRVLGAAGKGGEVGEPPGETMEPVAAADAPGLAELWGREASRGCLAPVRPLDWWRREIAVDDVKRAELVHRPFPDPARLFVLRHGGTPTAHAYIDEREGRMVVTDGAAADDATADRALQDLARLATARGTEEFAIVAGPGNRLARAGMRARGSFRMVRPNAGFTKVVAPYAFLKSLEPVLSSRWVDRGGDGVGTIAVDLDGQSASLVYDYDGVAVRPVDWRPNLRLTPQALTRLALGCSWPGEDLLTELNLPRAVKHAFGVLFPPAHPDPGQYTF